MHADACEVFVYGYILKFRAVIRQKYLGSAKSQDNSFKKVLAFALRMGMHSTQLVKRSCNKRMYL